VRILVVNWQDRTNPQAGGAEVHLHEIFSRLAARGHEVHLLCSGWRGAPADDVLDGMRIHRVSSRYGFPFAAAPAFTKLAGALKPDVVVEDVNKIPLNLTKQWRGPFVLLVPHLFGTTALREVPLPLAAMVLAAEQGMPRTYAGAAVHAISGSTRDDLVKRGFRADRIRVIYPGVDTAHFTPAAAAMREQSPTFLYVGRLKRYKQVDVAIRALRRLQATHAGARLWVAGSGDDRPRLERIAREQGVSESVKFLGFVSEEQKLELYRKAWAAVLPSLKEGWGITNLEAAGCATPALVADNSALRESVRDGETGYLFPTGSVEGLADVMGRLAADNDLRERLGRGARAFAETFSWERTALESESHLEAAIADKAGGQEP
jgi:glycosyltransferase involved in cell wall biosynthesis